VEQTFSYTGDALLIGLGAILLVYILVRVAGAAWFRSKRDFVHRLINHEEEKEK